MQTIYLREGQTEYSGTCEACVAAEGTLYAPKGDPAIAGTLNRYVDVGFRSCRRGHRLLVRRVRIEEAA